MIIHRPAPVSPKKAAYHIQTLVKSQLQIDSQLKSAAGAFGSRTVSGSLGAAFGRWTQVI